MAILIDYSIIKCSLSTFILSVMGDLTDHTEHCYAVFGMLEMKPMPLSRVVFTHYVISGISVQQSKKLLFF